MYFYITEWLHEDTKYTLNVTVYMYDVKLKIYSRKKGKETERMNEERKDRPARWKTGRNETDKISLYKTNEPRHEKT